MSRRTLILLISLTAASIALRLPLGAQCLEWKDGFALRDGLNNRGYALAVFDDGSGPALYAGGYFTAAGGVNANHVAKWNGSTWSPLGSGTAGGFGYVSALAVFDDGTGPALYAGGSFDVAGGVSASNIAKWNGSNWAPVGGGVGGITPIVISLTVFDDGSGPALYVGGQFSTAGGVPANNIARWDGAHWTPLGSGTDTRIQTLAVFDDGSGSALYVGGQFTTAGGLPAPNAARWNGTSWSSLGTGTNCDILAMTVFDDGNGAALYAAGCFTTAGGVSANFIAKWDGTAWSALGSGIVGYQASSLCTYNDGSGPQLYVGGWFVSAGGGTQNDIARWNGSTWVQMSGVGGVVFGLAVFDDALGGGPQLYACGDMTWAGSTAVDRIARWNGADWGSPTAGMRGDVLALTVFNDGSGSALCAGGRFELAGGVYANHIAKWNGDEWAALGQGITGSSPDTAYVTSLAASNSVSGPVLYVAGNFTHAGWGTAANVAGWDGSNWFPLGNGTNAQVRSLTMFDDGSGTALYAGGDFTAAGSVGASFIAKWDGTTWMPLGSGTNGPVLVLCVFDDGSGSALYAGGEFTAAGAVNLNHIGRWNGSTWSPVGTGTNETVRAICGFEGGLGSALYVGGEFGSAGGTPAYFIARWNGATWSAVGAGTNGPVNSLIGFDDGTGGGPALCIAGEFTVTGPVSASRIAKWDGTSWSALGSGLSDKAYALAAYDDGLGRGPDLFVGGHFLAAGGRSSNRIGSWRGCAHAGLSFCFGDGSVGTCPCGNQGSPGRGCANSAVSAGAVLRAGGTPRLSLDTLFLTSMGEPSSSLSIFLQGDSQVPPTTFGDGLRCVGGRLRRLYLRNADGGVASVPSSGQPSVSVQSARCGDAISSGAVRYYQTYYRDPVTTFCSNPPGGDFNVSNGFRVVWQP